jgi:LCP family protein required for cell wall assembly
MDRSRYKRPVIQKQRQQTTKTAFGNSAPVPRVLPPRPRISESVAVAPQRAVGGPFNRPPQAAAPKGDISDRLRARPAAGAPSAAAMHAKTAPSRRRRAHLSLKSIVTLDPVTPPAAELARRTPIDMDLPGEDSPPARWFKRPRWTKFRRLALRSTAVAVVLVITFGGLLLSQTYLKLHKVFQGSTGTAAALNEHVQPDLLKGEGRGRVNVLLLGRGGGDHDAPDLTDTLMIASIDPVNKSATLLSVPRDLWVNVPGQGVMKLNAAWQTGEFKYLGKIAPGSNDPKAIQAGFDMIDQTMNSVLGITIDYNVLVDFQAFKQAVDTVGGVSVNVPADLVDPTMAWENNNNPVLATAGEQMFDGKKALLYARSRETSSDFARAERQRALLLALKTKVVSLGTLSNPVKLSGLMDAFGDNVKTDLSLNNASRLYGILKGINNTKITSISLADSANPFVTTGTVAGQSVVLPKDGLFSYGSIQAYVRSQLKDPYILKENARVMVLNGTSTPGIATAKSDDLKSYGYNVVGVGNTPSPVWTSTTVVDLTHKNKYTKNYLEKRFGVKALNSLADKSIPTNGADFVIIVGSDEATNTQNQAD